ncbi:hypothetical protein R3Q59_38280 [Rhodococcus jostii]|uniref:Uncharacterized protein n=1 Tax=Rhodococcus jostii TaxID=132919 RepID=A0ABU4CS13_RHOJO|nr:hypothetical protein [Rhodococcus jostii]MDV6286334.1 hypothetical protein [Rhodococcus jostii]
MLIAAGALESAAEKLGEQMVITEPVAVVVEAAQEKIPLFDLLEQRLPAGRVGKDPREVAADLFRNRSDHQEVEKFGGGGEVAKLVSARGPAEHWPSAGGSVTIDGWTAPPDSPSPSTGRADDACGAVVVSDR